VVRTCYLLLVHHKFDQALRLVRRLAAADCRFVLHVDSAADVEDVSAFRRQLQPFNPVYAPSVNSKWGSYRLALAVMRCVQAAVRQLEPLDRYVLLSGQDYPIAAPAQIAEFFSAHPDKEFIEAFAQDVNDPDVPGWSPYFRFKRYHLWIGNLHLRLPFLRKGVPPLPIFHGSTWWALTRNAMVYVSDQFDSNRRLKRYLRTSFLADEAYIPTLMMGSPFASAVTGHNLTFAKWTPTSGPHPKTLHIEDLAELLSSNKLFARKFDALVDEAVMNKLDALLQVESHPPTLDGGEKTDTK
jgi:Core-2/I-Branching enzyme